MLGLTLALEVELNVIQGGAYLLEGSFGVEVGVAPGQELADVAQAPPAGLLIFLGATEALANHLHQVIQPLEGLVLLYQHGYLAVVQPETLSLIKQMKGLGIKLLVTDIVLEVDVAIDSDADKTAASRRIHQRLHLVCGSDERGIAPELFDGLAVGRTELDVA